MKEFKASDCPYQGSWDGIDEVVTLCDYHYFKVCRRTTRKCNYIPHKIFEIHTMLKKILGY